MSVVVIIVVVVVFVFVNGNVIFDNVDIVVIVNVVVIVDVVVIVCDVDFHLVVQPDVDGLNLYASSARFVPDVRLGRADDLIRSRRAAFVKVIEQPTGTNGEDFVVVARRSMTPAQRHLRCAICRRIKEQRNVVEAIKVRRWQGLVKERSVVVVRAQSILTTTRIKDIHLTVVADAQLHEFQRHAKRWLPFVAAAAKIQRNKRVNVLAVDHIAAKGFINVVRVSKVSISVQHHVC